MTPGFVAPLRAHLHVLWKAHAAFLVLAAVLLGAIGVLTAMFHEVYESVTDGHGFSWIDHPVMDAALALRSAPLTWLAQTVTWLGGTTGAVVVGLVLLGALTAVRRDGTPAAILPAAMAGSLAITAMGKNVVGRVRPPHELALPPFETSPSFPSGHTLNATVLIGAALYLVVISRRITLVGSHARAVRAAAVAALAWVVLMGLSRVYLGEHWITDVMAGWIIGLAWVLAVVLAHRGWLAVRSGRAVTPSPARSGR